MTASSAPLTPRSTLLPAMGLLAIIVICWLVYSPGLSGAFLFDDWVNLPTLGAQGPIDNWHTLVTYLLSGIAGPTGRPVALLSFLLDANNWPASPEPFKYTNILFHLLNGCLLAWLTLNLARVLNLGEAQAAWTAALSAGIWLLHPLMVSTTLFIVQRMTMLAATFVLAGLLCYVRGRRQLVQGRTRAGYLWMTAGLIICGALALLSKENGALLVLFVVLIEGLVLQHPASPLRIQVPTPGWRAWQVVFLYLPLALMGAYIIVHIPSMLHTYADVRDFTIGERLLTEARIVVRYLALLVIPRAYTGGLYHDDIVLSTDLVHPWSTLPAVALLFGLIMLAWRVRRRHPMVALAIFFYFAGQLLESSVIPLELYFEHRNYLPSVFLFLPLAHWLTSTSKRHRALRSGAAVGLLVLMAALTATRASLWGKPFEQAAVWAAENPSSPRAQTTLALHWMHRGNYNAAVRVLEPVARVHRDDIMVELNLLSAHCGLSGVTASQTEDARRALRHALIGSRVAYNAIGRFIRHYQRGTCPGLGAPQLDALINAALQNPHVNRTPGWLQNMLTVRGELRIAQHKPSEALALFNNALEADPRPGAALYIAAMLGTAGYPGRGLTILNYYQHLHRTVLGGSGVRYLRSLWLAHNDYYVREFAHLRKLLTQDATHRARNHRALQRQNYAAHSAPRAE